MGQRKKHQPTHSAILPCVCTQRNIQYACNCIRRHPNKQSKFCGKLQNGRGFNMHCTDAKKDLDFTNDYCVKPERQRGRCAGRRWNCCYCGEDRQTEDGCISCPHRCCRYCSQGTHLRTVNSPAKSSPRLKTGSAAQSTISKPSPPCEPRQAPQPASRSEGRSPNPRKGSKPSLQQRENLPDPRSNSSARREERLPSYSSTSSSRGTEASPSPRSKSSSRLEEDRPVLRAKSSALNEGRLPSPCPKSSSISTEKYPCSRGKSSSKNEEQSPGPRSKTSSASKETSSSPHPAPSSSIHLIDNPAARMGSPPGGKVLLSV